MDPHKIINQSGFPLQIGLARAIDESQTREGWRVLYQEHGWTHPSTGEQGFIDLVVENDPRTVVVNVECKRPQEATWQFLLPKPDDSPVSRARYWASYLSREGTQCFGWLDLELDPSSYESAFCVTAGQDSKNRPMLERVAAAVVASTEALAHEESELLAQREYPSLRTYVNVIATTARLQVCKFDPAGVDLATGMISDGQTEDVPWVRFRKQLSPLSPPWQPVNAWDFEGMAKAKESTVLVVQATELVNLLTVLQIDRGIGHAVTRGR